MSYSAISVTHSLPPALACFRRFGSTDGIVPLQQTRRLAPHFGLEAIVGRPTGILVPQQEVDKDLGVLVGPVSRLFPVLLAAGHIASSAARGPRHAVVGRPRPVSRFCARMVKR